LTDASPTLLLTNDDGWDAPGLVALNRAAVRFGRCCVVAPSAPISGCGHRVTTHGSIVVSRPAKGYTAVAGTPADCVRLALNHLAPRPNWVLAGINAGGNLGTDIHYSGTVAAVREAVIHGIPGIALSQYQARGRLVDWTQSSRWTEAILELLLQRPSDAGTFWNVNLPHLKPGEPDPEIVFCPVDPSPLPLAYQVKEDESVYAGDYQSRDRLPDADVAVCFGGKIAVSLIRINESTLCPPATRPTN
jgi:5'-nucleotidase